MPPIANNVGQDAQAETLSVRVDGELIGSLHTGRYHEWAKIEVDLAPGFHRYELRGSAVLKTGVQPRMSGSGIIASHHQLWPRFRDAGGLVAGFRAALADAPDLESMKGDVVYADIGGPMVFFYAADKRCPDGEPCFEHGFLDDPLIHRPGTDLWRMYFSPGYDQCDWKRFMTEKVYQSVIESFWREAASVSKIGWIFNFEWPERSK